MPNIYTPLGALKAILRITSTNFDAALLRLAEDVARAVDETCNRHFFDELATRYYDGTGRPSLLLDMDDLLTVTTVKIDEDGDGVFEKTLTLNTDYFRYPHNGTRAYRLDINPSSSQASVWPGGRRRVEIVAKYGFSAETETSGTTAEDVDVSETTITMTAGHGLTGGETIEISGNGEQIFVSAVATNDLTVVRAVNGTTAVTSTSGAAVTRRRYDRLIERACFMQIARFWRDSQSGGASASSSQEFGGGPVTSLYPAIRDLLNARRQNASG